VTATTRMRRQRAGRAREGLTRERLWVVSVIAELVPSPCIARGVGVPAKRLDGNMRPL